MELGLQGRVVLITGGSNGIGLATAERLAEQGAQLAICARNPERLEREAERLRTQYGAEVVSVVADVATADGVQRFVEAALQRYGDVDGLVNNAGAGFGAPFASIDDAAWQADLDLKLFGAIRSIRACLPSLVRTRGAIVNVLAISAKHPGAGSMPSSVSRAAGLALTKALSKEYAAQGVRVNAVCIGMVMSGQIEQLRQRTAPDADRDDFYAQIAHDRNVPLGRIGSASEAGDLIAFLLSERAAYLTGVAVNVDGGLSSST